MADTQVCPYLGCCKYCCHEQGSVDIAEILISLPLDIYPEVVVLDHIIILILIFGGNFILFSIAAAPIYIPINSTHMFCVFLNPHQHLRSLVFFITASWVDFLKTIFLFLLHSLMLSHIHFVYIYPGWRKVGWKRLTAGTEREMGMVLVTSRCSLLILLLDKAVLYSWVYFGLVLNRDDTLSEFLSGQKGTDGSLFNSISHSRNF